MATGVRRHLPGIGRPATKAFVLQTAVGIAAVGAMGLLKLISSG